MISLNAKFYSSSFQTEGGLVNGHTKYMDRNEKFDQY